MSLAVSPVRLVYCSPALPAGGKTIGLVFGFAIWSLQEDERNESRNKNEMLVPMLAVLTNFLFNMCFGKIFVR